MTEHIVSGGRKRFRPGNAAVAAQVAFVACFVSMSAAAERPCPPKLEATDGTVVVSPDQSCPVETGGQSSTPEYKDPMISCPGLASRRVVKVGNATALAQAMSSAVCGDTIQLEPGNFGGSFSIGKACPMTSPVIIQGAPNFQSIVSGQFQINGARTIVTGIRFSGPDARIRVGGENNKILGNTFTDWRSVAITTAVGKQVEIAYNEFSKPHPWLASEAGGYPLRIGIRTAEKGPDTFHFDAWVHHNYFHDFPAKPDPSKYNSGQSDAIEVCESGRTATATMESGWYIESNLVERHLQGHGIVDFKCGGNVVRYNTIVDSPGGRMDARAGSYNIFESNWIENSGGSTIRGGHNKVVGNRVIGGQINVMAGDMEWNTAGGGYPRAYGTLLAANDAKVVNIGKANSANSKYPAHGTVVEAHIGPAPSLALQENTVIKSSTAMRFAPARRLSRTEIGPQALLSAPADYLACRAP